MRWILALFLACSTPAPPIPEPEPAQEPVPAPPPEPEPLPDPTESHYAASHVQIPWTGAIGAPSDLERTEEEAHALAERLHASIAHGADLGKLAREQSSDSSGRRGGALGVWRTGVMDPEFERCVAAAEVGGLAPLCRTPFGWHVIRREPVALASGHHLVVWKQPDLEAARARAEALHQALLDGRPPASLAGEADRHEPLGPTSPGQLIPLVDQALFGLPPGGVSDILESEAGLHLVARSPE